MTRIALVAPDGAQVSRAADLEPGATYRVAGAIDLAAACALAGNLPDRSALRGWGVYPPERLEPWIRLGRPARDSGGQLQAAGVVAAVGVVWREPRGVVLRVWPRAEPGHDPTWIDLDEQGIGAVVKLHGRAVRALGWTVAPLEGAA